MVVAIAVVIIVVVILLVVLLLVVTRSASFSSFAPRVQLNSQEGKVRFKKGQAIMRSFFLQPTYQTYT